MALDFKYGRMVQNMKDNGKTIKLMVMENSGILMVTFMKEIGLMIRPMDMEYIYIQMEQNMKVNG